MDTQDEIGYSKQIMYNTVGTMVTLFCQWLIIMIIPKITDFSEAGIFAVAISVCSILNPIATFSLREYQISDQNLRFTDADYRAVRIVTITLSLVAVIPFVVIFGYGLIEIAAILGYLVYRNLLHYAYLYSASLQINNRLDLVGIHSIVEGIFSFVSFVLVYVLTKDLIVATFVMALVGGGAFLGLQFISYKKCVEVKKESYDKDRAKQLLLIGLPLCFSVLALALMNSMPKLFLQSDCGDALAGIFSTLSAPTILIPTLATSIFAPFIVYFTNLARAGDMKAIRRRYTMVIGAILGLGLICVIASIFLQSWIFETLYGEEVKPYSKYFAYLVAGITVYSIGNVGITVLITKDQGKIAAPLSFVAVFIGLIGCITLIPGMEIEGATYALVAAYLVFGTLISLAVYLLPLKQTVVPCE